MAKVIVTNHITLDGVMQAPGRPDEDSRDGFEHRPEIRSVDDAQRAASLAELHPPKAPSPLSELRLVDSVTTTTGVLIVTYEPAEP